MICSQCLKSFTPRHGNQKYCSRTCIDAAQKAYARQYQRQRRKAGKSRYKLHQVGRHIFFVLPLRYTRVLNHSQDDWFVSSQAGIDSIQMTIARQGVTPLRLTGKQYRVYLEEDTCCRFAISITLAQWGVTFSARDDHITALIEYQWT